MARRKRLVSPEVQALQALVEQGSLLGLTELPVLALRPAMDLVGSFVSVFRRWFGFAIFSESAFYLLDSSLALQIVEVKA